MPEADNGPDSAESRPTAAPPAGGEQDHLDETAADQASEDQDQATDNEDDDPLALTKLFDEQEGFRDSHLFRSDQEWLRSIGELKRKIGQREEDAQIGRQVRQRLATDPSSLESLLGAAGSRQEKPADAPPDFDPGWITVGQDGRMQLAYGAPKDALEKYDTYTRWATHRLHKLLTDPGKFLEGVISPKLKEIEERNEAVRAEAADREQRATLDAACTKHRNVLYVGGDRQRGLTPLGQQISEMIGEVAQNADQAARLIERVAAIAPRLQVKPTDRKLSARAGRTPQAGLPTEQSREERETTLKQSGGLSRLLAESARKERAAAI